MSTHFEHRTGPSSLIVITIFYSAWKSVLLLACCGPLRVKMRRKQAPADFGSSHYCSQADWQLTASWISAPGMPPVGDFGGMRCGFLHIVTVRYS